MKTIFIIFSILLLVYMILPGPTKVGQFKPLPDSIKSTEPGDTIQKPNVAAFFSNHYRNEVILFYKGQFSSSFNYLGFNLPFVRLNHPPQYAAEVIRPYQESWYLEEFVHPLRESLYVNGWEPFDEKGIRRNRYAFGITINMVSYNSKTTLRYYTSPLWVRIFVWAGITFSIVLLFKLAKRSLKEIYV